MRTSLNTFKHSYRNSFRSFNTSKSRQFIELSYERHVGSEALRKIPDNSVPDLVILHGLFGSKRNYRALSKSLARKLKNDIYAVDLRNHGDSPHSPEHNYVLLADDVRHFIQQHDLKRPVLIGHSMGAKAAMTLALTSPSIVEGLIAVDNAPIRIPMSDDFANYIRGMKAIEDTRVSSRSQADEILCAYEPSLAIRQFLLTNLEKPVGENHFKFSIPLDYLSTALSTIANFPYDPAANIQYTKPALFLRGSRSQYVSKEAEHVISHFFPSYTLQKIEAGHWVASENPEAFCSAVVDFVNKL